MLILKISWVLSFEDESFCLLLVMAFLSCEDMLITTPNGYCLYSYLIDDAHTCYMFVHAQTPLLLYSFYTYMTISNPTYLNPFKVRIHYVW